MKPDREEEVIKTEKVRVNCHLCKTPLVIKKVDMGTQYKYELLCAYCGVYKVWFEEKPVVKPKKGKKKDAA